MASQRSWKVTLEYDGSRYRGWAEQTNVRTVMGEVRKACEDLFEGKVEIQGAGRTDAGVHALGQVAHVRASPRRPIHCAQILEGLNERLPYDIAVREVLNAPLSFHARRDALSRTYLYRLATQKDAFGKNYTWWIRRPLNIDAMTEAAAALPGRHDFALFRAKDPARPDESSIVVVESAAFDVSPHQVEFRIEASHFIWRMVRRIVGVLVRVGLGEAAPAQFRALVNAQPQEGIDVAAWTAPASGLFLEKVRYPD